MSVPSRSVTAASSISLCLLILIFRGATLVTSPFFVPLVLKTSKEKFIDLVGILLSLTNCSSIPVCVQLESTSAFTFSFLLFFVLMFACTFNSFFSSLVQWFGIIYLLFWEFTWVISCTMSTRDCYQNPPLFCYFHHLIFSGPFISSSSVFFYNPWQCILSCHIWNMFVFLVSSFLIGILLPCVHICYNWSTLVSCPWISCLTSQCLWVVLFFCRLFLYLFCNHFVPPWIQILVLLMWLPLFTPWVCQTLLWVGNPILSW